VPVPPVEFVDPAEGAAVEDVEPPAPPPPLELLLELLEDPCAHAAPAIRQPAIKAVETVRRRMSVSFRGLSDVNSKQSHEFPAAPRQIVRVTGPAGSRTWRAPGLNPFSDRTVSALL
jgi:hypothetical protein